MFPLFRRSSDLSFARIFGCWLLVATVSGCSGAPLSVECSTPPCSEEETSDSDGPSDPCDACGEQEVCFEGECILGECPDSTYECDGTCSTLVDDPRNCGSCGTDCGNPPNGSATCANAECIYECDVDAIECDGGCALCPDGAGSVTCRDGACAATSCEQGYQECEGQCYWGPNVQSGECDNGVFEVTSCYSPTHVTEHGAECLCAPTVASGIHWLDPVALQSSTTKCGSGYMNWISSARICGEGTWFAYIYGAEGAAAYGARTVEGACEDYDYPGQCEDEPDEHRMLIKELTASECMMVQAEYTSAARPSPLRADFLGPATQIDPVAVTLSSDGTLTLPQNMIATYLEFHRDAGPSNETIEVRFELPDGSVVEKQKTWSTNPARVWARVPPGSSLSVSGISHVGVTVQTTTGTYRVPCSGSDCPGQSGTCGQGLLEDCEGDCVSQSLLGDGECHAQLNCSTHEYDASDCSGVSSCGENKILDCDGECVSQSAWGDGECDSYLYCPNSAAGLNDGGDCEEI